MPRSKLLPVLAAVGTVVGMLSLSVATAMAAQQQTVSAALAKPLKTARDAIEAKKYSEAIAKLQEVQATSGRSAYDEYVVNEMLGIAYAQTSRYAEAAKALEAALRFRRPRSRCPRRRLRVLRAHPFSSSPPQALATPSSSPAWLAPSASAPSHT